MISEGKPCQRCGVEKPLEDFHRDSTRIDGYRPYCKVCVRNYVSKGRVAKTTPHKKCNSCDRLLPAKMFSYSPRTPDKLNSKCTTCKSYTGPRPSIDIILGHEKRMRDVYSVARERLRKLYPNESPLKVVEDHRSEFEQFCWTIIQRDPSFKMWKPPTWIHESSKP